MASARVWRRILISACSTWLCAGGVLAQETTTYSYDPLGRLTGSTISGGPNTGVKTTTCFDSAGNRTQYQTGSSSQQACSTPTPASESGPPTPPPAPPQPPLVATYSGSGKCQTSKTFNIVQNDTDPGGHYPITVVSVTGTDNVEASVASSTSITLIGGYTGTDVIAYVVTDSVGATSAGIFTYSTTGGTQICGGGNQ